MLYHPAPPCANSAPLRFGPLLEQKDTFVFEKMSDFVARDWADERSYTEYKLKFKLNFMCLSFTDYHH
jgi:hypothetical protein